MSCLGQLAHICRIRSSPLTLVSVLSVKGNKVLHIDRNDHYGGEAASINIETVRNIQFYSKVWI